MTLYQVILNIVPNKYITWDEEDPAWMNDIIESKIKAKNRLYQVYVKKAGKKLVFVLLKSQYVI